MPRQVKEEQIQKITLIQFVGKDKVLREFFEAELEQNGDKPIVQLLNSGNKTQQLIQEMALVLRRYNHSQLKVLLLTNYARNIAMNDEFLQQHWEQLQQYQMMYCCILVHYISFCSYREQVIQFDDWVLDGRERHFAYSSPQYCIELANYINNDPLVSYERYINSELALEYLLIAKNNKKDKVV